MITTLFYYLFPGYSLKVDPASKSVLITASQPSGAFYAVQTLLSLAGEDGKVGFVLAVDRKKFNSILIAV